MEKGFVAAKLEIIRVVPFCIVYTNLIATRVSGNVFSCIDFKPENFPFLCVKCCPCGTENRVVELPCLGVWCQRERKGTLVPAQFTELTKTVRK